MTPPTVRHPQKQQALDEARRLADKTRENYFVLETIAVIEPAPIALPPSTQMTDLELATFLDMGCWRPNATGPDRTAYLEAARRLRFRHDPFA